SGACRGAACSLPGHAEVDVGEELFAVGGRAHGVHRGDDRLVRDVVVRADGDGRLAGEAGRGALQPHDAGLEPRPVVILAVGRLADGVAGARVIAPWRDVAAVR